MIVSGIVQGGLMFVLGFAAAFLAWFLWQQIQGGNSGGPTNAPITTGGIPYNG